MINLIIQNQYKIIICALQSINYFLIVYIQKKRQMQNSYSMQLATQYLELKTQKMIRNQLLQKENNMRFQKHQLVAKTIKMETPDLRINTTFIKQLLWDLQEQENHAQQINLLEVCLSLNTTTLLLIVKFTTMSIREIYMSQIFWILQVKKISQHQERAGLIKDNAFCLYLVLKKDSHFKISNNFLSFIFNCILKERNRLFCVEIKLTLRKEKSPKKKDKNWHKSMGLFILKQVQKKVIISLILSMLLLTVQKKKQKLKTKIKAKLVKKREVLFSQYAAFSTDFAVEFPLKQKIHFLYQIFRDLQDQTKFQFHKINILTKQNQNSSVDLRQKPKNNLFKNQNYIFQLVKFIQKKVLFFIIGDQILQINKYHIINKRHQYYSNAFQQQTNNLQKFIVTITIKTEQYLIKVFKILIINTLNLNLLLLVKVYLRQYISFMYKLNLQILQIYLEYKYFQIKLIYKKQSKNKFDFFSQKYDLINNQNN
ncbi:transmembrane protein, putative (macronuclear) [Tetrahymena thermophila SB210]|uniref:Transmembrane protein, putative n=1 Tax=Tetrahymena thermophila (strain SB210) TaxID=312017 RepID=W7XC14_TETTS|nr:transmembrane protein, putative [Tetrahymena thermophila SB210]EWS74892.1 transmembrane protein, putative [Tetrahymena thermophila SB210]|eukprot:XP_012652605.1 transmembrane protein, putative [Tetrahymena thermophila SB210]